MEELDAIHMQKEVIEISGDRKLYNYTFSAAEPRHQEETPEGQEQKDS